MAGDEEYDQLVVTQRLKAAIHYTVGRIATEHEEDERCTFSRQLIAAVSEAVFKYSQTLARDLELFAKHAKRVTVNTDDVILTVRKSRKLSEYLRAFSEETAAKDEGRKERKRKKEGVPITGGEPEVAATDEESNM